MNNKINLKNIYSDIRELLFKLIPEKWESIFLYASVSNNAEKKGEMYFYYFPKSVIKKNPINVYSIPAKFNINETDYLRVVTRLYEKIKILKAECMRLEKIDWSNITISIENVAFSAEYNFDDLENSDYTEEERRIIWQCKYLDFPIDKLSKNERNIVDRYFRETEMGGHKTKLYMETFYQKHEHNDVSYEVETKTEQIQEVDKDKKINQLLKFK